MSHSQAGFGPSDFDEDDTSAAGHRPTGSRRQDAAYRDVEEEGLQGGPGYDQDGYDQGGYDQGGYDQGGPGYDQGGPGYDQDGYDQGAPGYDQDRYDQGGPGFGDQPAAPAEPRAGAAPDAVAKRMRRNLMIGGAAVIAVVVGVFVVPQLLNSQKQFTPPPRPAAQLEQAAPAAQAPTAPEAPPAVAPITAADLGGAGMTATPVPAAAVPVPPVATPQVQPAAVQADPEAQRKLEALEAELAGLKSTLQGRDSQVQEMRSVIETLRGEIGALKSAQAQAPASAPAKPAAKPPVARQEGPQAAKSAKPAPVTPSFQDVTFTAYAGTDRLARSGGRINLRREPSETARVDARLGIGAPIEVTGMADGWYRVRHEGRQLYVAAALTSRTPVQAPTRAAGRAAPSPAAAQAAVEPTWAVKSAVPGNAQICQVAQTAAGTQGCLEGTLREIRTGQMLGSKGYVIDIRPSTDGRRWEVVTEAGVIR